MSLGTYLRNHPRLLEWAYDVTHRVFDALNPAIAKIGYARADAWLRGPEEFGKKLVFDCRMCGQCVLHSTGMTCPMTCPKILRNGPCGGVRVNGHCEVIPTMRCVWVQAFERSQKMVKYGDDLLMLNPPVNRQLEGSSAWINMLTEEDVNVPSGWKAANPPS